jgi:PhnB protein
MAQVFHLSEGCAWIEGTHEEMAMVTRLNPYITFAGNAREAMEFYHSVFGGELDVSTYGEMPDMPGNSPEIHDQLMHAMLTVSESITLMGADMPDSPGPKGSPISIALSGDDEQQLRAWFDGLADGGEVLEPMEIAPWGSLFGMLHDRFGVHWMLSGDETQS